MTIEPMSTPFEQMYANKLEHLDVMDKFQESTNYQKWLRVRQKIWLD